MRDGLSFLLKNCRERFPARRSEEEGYVYTDERTGKKYKMSSAVPTEQERATIESDYGVYMQKNMAKDQEKREREQEWEEIKRKL